MIVTLNIQNDAELRAHIKDAVKGQVMSIVREELIEIIKSELDRKVKGWETQHFQQVMKMAMDDILRDILYKKYDVSSWGESFLRPYINEILDKVTKGNNWDALIEKTARERMKALLTQIDTAKP